MKTQNFAISLVKYSVVGALKHFLYWPLWWYTSGLFYAFKSTGRRIKNTWKSLALGIWLQNIFRPMYGQYDAASRIISFLMRFIQIVFRMIIMIILTVIFTVLFFVYMALPPATVWLLLKQ